MSNLKDTCQENSETVCNNRREFLVKASATAGGILLTLAAGSQSAKAKTADTPDDENVIVKLDDKSPLGKVGGFDTISTKSGKVIVVRTGDMTFSAYSAICTHKGATLKYNAEKKLLICPSHGSQFDADGKVVKGPATTNLATYGAQESVVVTLTPKA
jgi:cytochrome b6-f complex iron-sulfur subunit